MRFLKFILFILFILFRYGLIAQEHSLSLLDSIGAQLINNIRSNESENIITVTDKSIYRPGETIWLKIFLLRSVSQKLSRKSKNVFVELVDDKDSVLSSLVMDAWKGQLNGKLYLDSSITTGNYWIRAYTNYIAEKEKNKISVNPVYVTNMSLLTGKIPPAANNYNPDNVSIQFYPEGGAMITGANTTVAFHITSNNMQPISGYVKDNRDSIVTRFASDEYGLGKFEFYPFRIRTYTAHLIWNGKDMAYPLPSFNLYAGQLAISKQNNGNRKIRILLEDSIYQKNFRTYIIGIAKDSLCFAGFGTGNYEVFVPEKTFPKGIATFYLLDEHFKLLSERSIYFSNNYLNVITNTDKSIYNKREKGNLTISIKDALDHAVPASISIAITESELVPIENNYTTITNYFNGQLTSENWSFEKTDDLSDDQLDILMMAHPKSYATHLQKNSAFIPLDNDSLFYIRGRVYYQNETPAAKKIVTLFSKSGNMICDVDTTDNNGRFVFPIAEYPDSSQFLVQVSDRHGIVEGVTIRLDTLTFPKVTTSSAFKRKLTITPTAVTKKFALNADTISMGNYKQLKTVTLKTIKKKELSYDESKRISQFSKIITGEKLIKGGSINNAVLSIAGVQILNGFVTVGGLAGFQPAASTEPIVVENGIQIFLPSENFPSPSPVLNYLSSLSPADISFIEILSGPEAAAYGVRGGHGVILINTKTSLTEEKSIRHLNTFTVKGYHTAPLFIIPDYENRENKNVKINDPRSTLYWSATNFTGEEGKIEIPFFTSNVPANYKVIITGVTIYGDFILRTFIFRVQ